MTSSSGLETTTCMIWAKLLYQRNKLGKDSDKWIIMETFTGILYWELSHIPTFSFESLFSGLAKLTHHPEGEYASFQVGQTATAGPFDISILELKTEDKLDLNVYTPACLAKTEDRGLYKCSVAVRGDQPEIKHQVRIRGQSGHTRHQQSWSF